MKADDDKETTMIHFTHMPTAEELFTERSIAVGTFEYPVREAFRVDGELDEGAYADACADTEIEVHFAVAEALNNHGIDTTNFEVRLSEFTPGEIRLYA